MAVAKKITVISYRLHPSCFVISKNPSMPAAFFPTLRNHWRGLAVCVAVVVIALILWGGIQIASPTRRQLMDYHREFLTEATAHGMKIDRFTASDGTPCLVCIPEPFGRLGERGIKIRKQLAERGLLLQPAGRITGNLVLLHGRTGRKEDYLPIAERLCAAGFRCMIPDLPAHGEHPASTITYGVREATLPANVFEEASQRYAFEKQPVGLLGMSMGGSVAMHSAALPDSPWKALVVISSFDFFPAAVEGQASRYIGNLLAPAWADAADLVYQQRTGISINAIQPHLKAESIRIPTFIVHGTSDRVVPMPVGKRLYEALPKGLEKRWQEIPGADHYDVLITSYPIYADIAEWMIRHVK